MAAGETPLRGTKKLYCLSQDETGLGNYARQIKETFCLYPLPYEMEVRHAHEEKTLLQSEPAPDDGGGPFFYILNLSSSIS